MNRFKVDKLKCAGCGACIQVCPYGAIKIEKDGKAIIDQKKCQKCGKCKETCPFNAIKEISEKNTQQKGLSAPLYNPSSLQRDFSYNLSQGKGLGRGRGPGWLRGIGRKRRGGR